MESEQTSRPVAPWGEREDQVLDLPEAPREAELIICHGCADPHECQAMKNCDVCGWAYCVGCLPSHECDETPEEAPREAATEGDDGGE